jgi:hypothetical protein
MSNPVRDDDELEGPTPLQMAYRVAVRAKMDVVKVIERIMETEWLNSKLMGFPEAEAAKTAEEYYGFAARDVAYVHHHQRGVIPGLFFRLYDGRVFNAGAEPQNPDRDLYDTVFH